MSAIKCGRCGRITNTALCDWVDNIDAGVAVKCYAAWDEEKECWVDGCAFNDKGADPFMNHLLQSRLNLLQHHNQKRHKRSQSNAQERYSYGPVML